MQHVNIVIQSGIRSIKPKDGCVGYLLEAQTGKGPATLSRVFAVTGLTANASRMTALIEALKRLREPCTLTIFTDSEYIAGAVEQGWPDRWEAADWKTSRGRDVANKELWQELYKLLKGHEVIFDTKNDIGYRSWLVTEINRKEKKHV